MKLLIVGLGSIGRRYARLLGEIPGHDLKAWRSRRTEPNDLGVKEIYSWEEVLRFRPEVAFITNPTDQHVSAAVRSASEGMHVFIEKPLSHSMEGIARLREVCRERGVTAYVAYVYRFHPVIMKLKEILQGKLVRYASATCASYLPDWRPGRDGHDVYSSYRARGGGVLLDLSHELDYLAFLLGEMLEITGSFGRLTDVTVDSEDVADMTITFKSKARASVHLDCISRLPRREVRVDFQGGSFEGDFLSGRVRLAVNGRHEEHVLESSRDDPFRRQLDYFFKNIHSPTIMNSLDEAVPLLGKILEFRNGRT